MNRRHLSRGALLTAALAVLGVAFFRLAFEPADPVPLREQPSALATAPATPEPVELIAAAKGAFRGCLGCHDDLDLDVEARLARGLTFTHDPHAQAGVAECGACHRTDTHSPDEVALATMEDCANCHGLALDAEAPGECATCHPPTFDGRPDDHFVAEWFEEHGSLDEQTCALCHTPESCSDCHGLEMPHGSDFEEQPHIAAYREGGDAACATCHPRATGQADDCDSCHHPDAVPTQPWLYSHDEAVADRGGGDCTTCHSPNTCASCHTTGREDYRFDST